MRKPHSAKSRGPARNFRGIVTFSDSISPDTLRLNPDVSRLLRRDSLGVEHGLLGTSVAEKASFVSRFLYKILEIMGAAVATAVSGYIVAHLGGFLPSQNQAATPSEVVAAPSEHPVPKSTPAFSLPSQASTSQAATSQSATSQSATSQTPTVPQPAAAEAKPASQPEPTGSASQTVVHKTAKTQPVRKSNKAETAASETGKPRETADTKQRDAAEAKSEAKSESKSEAKSESKPRDAADAKAREAAESKPREAEDKESVEARVRAALANVDANRPAPPAEVPPPRRGEGQAGAQPVSAVATPSRPLELPSAAAGGGQQPRSADLGSSTPQPAVSQSPVVQPAALSGPAAGQSAVPPSSEALTTVEIKSRPVATVDTPRAPEAAPSPAPEERGVFQTLKHILPDFSRPASSDETPRPPAAVGQ
jgi:hypothetical protein